jgi:outer membrane protein
MRSLFRCALIAAAVAGASLISLAARAQEEEIPGQDYHWQAQVRGIYLIPSNTHLPQDFNVSGAFTGELAGEWFFLPHWSTEVSVAIPTNLNVQTGAGSIRIMPETWTVKYYFTATNGLQPYIGTGLYYASTSSSNTQPNVGVGNSGVGWVLQGGLTYAITPNVFVSGDVRYLNGLEPPLSVDNAPSGHVGIDPVVIGVGIGVRF